MALLDTSVWTGKIYVNGWRDGRGGTEDVTNPSTDETLGQIGFASPEDVYEAAETAAAAQKEWAALKPSERAAVLAVAHTLLDGPA